MKNTLQKRPFIVTARDFKRLLRNSPELLPVAEIDATYAPLVCIGREVGTPENALLSRSKR
jgi:hypothetical protein